MREIWPIARRLVLPGVLLVACMIAWLVSARWGDVSVTDATGLPASSLDTPLASVRRLPEVATTSLQAQQLELALAALPDPSSPLSCVTIMAGDEIVHGVRGDSPLLPGLAQLLVTGHVALDRLGPDHRFVTTAMASYPATDEGLIGASLYLVGSGDPVLMSRNYSHGFRPMLTTRTSIEALADAVIEAGVTTIGSSVVGVEQRFDDQRVLPGWPTSYTESGLVGPLSALQLDDGFQTRASANGGVAIAADDPAAHAAARFDDLLEARGVQIHGLARSLEPDGELPDLVPIASVQSPPLSEIVLQMLAANDASAAEMLMKELGVEFRQSGTTRAGADAIRLTLAQQGVELAVPPRDGSGLDPVSTSTCDSLARTLATVPQGHATLAALPGYDLPGVYHGEFADLAIESDLALIGGHVGDTASFIARTVAGDGLAIVMVSLLNRPSGIQASDIAYHRDLVASIDGLRQAMRDRTIAGS